MSTSAEFLHPMRTYAGREGTEQKGVAVTVVVIDWFYEKRRERERLQEVIAMIASGSRHAEPRQSPERG